MKTKNMAHKNKNNKTYGTNYARLSKTNKCLCQTPL